MAISDNLENIVWASAMKMKLRFASADIARLVEKLDEAAKKLHESLAL